MCRPRDQLHGLVAGQRRQGLPVQSDDAEVVGADHKQGGRRDLAKCRAGEVGPAAARDDRLHPRAERCRRHESRGGPGAGAEEAKRKTGQLGLLIDPGDSVQQPVSEQVYVEDLAAVPGLAFGKQVEEQGGEASGVQVVGHGAIARAQAARATAVGKQDDAPGIGRCLQITGQREGRQPHLAAFDDANRCGRFHVPDLTQQTQGLLVRELVKVAIEGTYAVETVRGMETDDDVCLGAHLFERFDGRYRHGENDLRRPLALQRAQRGPGGGSRGQPIVDHDRGAAGRTEVPPPAEIERAPSLNLVKLSATGLLKIGRIAAGHAANRLVDDGLRILAVNDGSQGELGLARRADLAHQDKVDRRLQRPGDLHRQRHPAARQGVDDRFGKIERLQTRRQLAPRVASVDEEGHIIGHDRQSGASPSECLDLSQPWCL